MKKLFFTGHSLRTGWLILILFCSTVRITSAQNYRLWATYYGGTALESVKSITTDASGNVYMAGHAMSTNAIATAGSYQPANAGSADAFLVKFNGAGVRLWATYYGGAGDDLGYAVKTDAAGNVYLAGYTYSTSGIATSTAYQTSLSGAGTRDGFLVKFDANGNRLWATYYGGEAEDQGLSLATDAAGNVYLGGVTSSTKGIALPGEFQDTFGGPAFDDDGFLVKFSSTGTRLWGTYYGGESFDRVNSVATDASGNVFIGGNTFSTVGIASAGAFKTTLTGSPNTYLAKFNSSGTRLWGTYYGGAGPDAGGIIATDLAGNVYMVGTTLSSTGIASGGFKNTLGGGNTTDAFLVKFNGAGARQWGTYYGGDSEDEGSGVATDAFGNVFFEGSSYGANIGNCIATPYGFQTSLTGLENQVLAVFNTAGLRLASTYYGKTHEEEGVVAVNSFGDIYIAGDASSTTGLTSAGSHQSTFGGGSQDALLVKFATAAPHEEVIVPNDTFPPVITSSPPKIYISVSVFNGGGISLTSCIFRNFSPGAPLPATGSSTIDFTCTFSGSYNNGTTSIPVSCPAHLKVLVTLDTARSDTRIYDTEMVELDLSGGSFPTGLKVRESPSLPKKGGIIINRLSGSQYGMASFFDIFTELSTDGGNNWIPNSDSVARMDLQDFSTSSVPTLSEWGLIALAGLMLSLGVFFLKNRIG